MDLIEQINDLIVITRTTTYNKIYLGTVQYNKLYYGKYDIYNETELKQFICINRDILLTQDEIDFIFNNKVYNNYNDNYKYEDNIYNINYVYLENGIKVCLEKFIMSKI